MIISIRRLLVTAMVAAAASAVLAQVPDSANAARDGFCDDDASTVAGGPPGEACFYRFSNLRGSLADFSSDSATNPDLYGADATLFDDYFISAGSGQGKRVSNNASSVCNTDRNSRLILHDGDNFTGL